MEQVRAERRLTAILAADVVAYSRMVGEDEEGTLAALALLRAEIFEPLIAGHRGRIVKLMGDGLLAAFVSVVDAVACAAAIQDALVARPPRRDGGERIRYRIGVNLGDIIDGDDILGDGVNIAARLEALAEPDGILISAAAHDQVEGKLDLTFENTGVHEVKNIRKPVQVYRVLADTVAPVPRQGASGDPPTTSGKPSVAILPFENLSNDPEQEYFSDGISEDLITALSRIHWFYVSARNSAFSYKGSTKDVRDIATELGVRYVVEGSVRKAGDRVRVTAQLVDGLAGTQVWAERYDRALGNVFDLQDEIIEKVVGALEPAISKSKLQRAKKKNLESLDGWDLCQRGWWHRNRNTPEDLEEARGLFARALDVEPDSASALAGMCVALTYQVIIGAAADPGAQIAEAVGFGKRAVAADGEDPLANLALGTAYGVAEDFDRAIRALQTALRLNPHYAAAHYTLGNVLITSGRLEDGIEEVRRAISLSPQDSWTAGFYARLAQAHLCLRDYAKARDYAEEALSRSGHLSWWARSYLVSALGHLGDSAAAKTALDDLLRHRPELTIGWVRAQRSNLSMGRDYLEDYLEGLRQAGVPA